MPRARTLATAWFAMLMVGCAHRNQSSMAAPTVLDTTSTDEQLDQSMGKFVVLNGIAENRKAGPVVRFGAHAVYLFGWNEWSAADENTPVQVNGVLRREFRKPPHVDKNGIPTVGGMFGRIYSLERAARVW
jgi:hypothetical protein